MSRGNAIGIRLVVAVVALASTLLGSPSAFAHSYVIATDPADGSTVQELPSSVSVTFNETIQNFEPVLVVTGPDQRPYAGAVSVVGPVISTQLTPGGPAGAYTVAYRVVSADGHPVSGQLGFTVAAESASPSGRTPTGDTASSSTASSPAPSSPASSTAASSTAASSPASTTAASSPAPTTAPSSPEATSSVSGTPAADPTAPSDGGPSWWLWVGVGLAVVVLAAAALVLARRPRRN